MTDLCRVIATQHLTIEQLDAWFLDSDLPLWRPVFMSLKWLPSDRAAHLPGILHTLGYLLKRGLPGGMPLVLQFVDRMLVRFSQRRELDECVALVLRAAPPDSIHDIRYHCTSINDGLSVMVILAALKGLQSLRLMVAAGTKVIHSTAGHPPLCSYVLFGPIADVSVVS
jgi:hypothetical protein